MRGNNRKAIMKIEFPGGKPFWDYIYSFLGWRVRAVNIVFIERGGNRKGVAGQELRMVESQGVIRVEIAILMPALSVPLPSETNHLSTLALVHRSNSVHFISALRLTIYIHGPHKTPDGEWRTVGGHKKLTMSSDFTLPYILYVPKPANFSGMLKRKSRPIALVYI